MVTNSARPSSGENNCRSVPVSQACEFNARISSNSAARRTVRRDALRSRPAAAWAQRHGVFASATHRRARSKSAAPSALLSSIRVRRCVLPTCRTSRSTVCGPRLVRPDSPSRPRDAANNCISTPGSHETSPASPASVRWAQGKAPSTRRAFSSAVQQCDHFLSRCVDGHAVFGHGFFQRIEPASAARAFAQQAQAVGQCVFITRGCAGVCRHQRKYQTVEKATAQLRAFEKQPVHCGRQPQNGHQLGNFAGIRRYAIEMKNPPRLRTRRWAAYSRRRSAIRPPARARASPKWPSFRQQPRPCFSAASMQAARRANHVPATAVTRLREDWSCRCHSARRARPVHARRKARRCRKSENRSARYALSPARKCPQPQMGRLRTDRRMAKTKKRIPNVNS